MSEVTVRAEWGDRLGIGGGRGSSKLVAVLVLSSRGQEVSGYQSVFFADKRSYIKRKKKKQNLLRCSSGVLTAAVFLNVRKLSASLLLASTGVEAFLWFFVFKISTYFM